MKHSTRIVIVVLFIVIISLSACDVKSTQPSNTKHTANNKNPGDVSLIWAGQNNKIIINGQWLYDVNLKKFEPLAMPLQRNKIKSARHQTTFFPGRDILFQFDGVDQLSFGQSGKAATRQVKIPIWLTTEPGTENDSIVNVPFWLNEQQIFVHQFNTLRPNLYACGIYVFHSAKWHNLDKTSCLESSFFNLIRVNTLRAGLVVAVSAAEGRHALDVMEVRETDTFKFTHKNLGELILASPLPEQIQQHNENITLIFPCILENTEVKLCKQSREQYWLVYDWAPQAGSLQARFPALKFSVTAAPDGDLFAWVKGNELCVGNPENARTECAELPF